MNKKKHSGRKSKDLKIEIIETREMTEQEVNNGVSILFTWWKGGYERRLADEADREKPNEPKPEIDRVI